MGSYVKVRVDGDARGRRRMINYTLLESPKPGGGETVPADDPRFRPARMRPATSSARTARR